MTTIQSGGSNDPYVSTGGGTGNQGIGTSTDNSSSTSGTTQTDSSQKLTNTQEAGKLSKIEDVTKKAETEGISGVTVSASNLPKLVKLLGAMIVPQGTAGVGNLWFSPSFQAGFMKVMAEVQKLMIKQGFQEAMLAKSAMLLGFAIAMTSAALTVLIATAEAAKEIVQAVTNFMEAGSAIASFAMRKIATSAAAKKQFNAELKTKTDETTAAMTERNTAKTALDNHDAKFKTGGELNRNQYAGLAKDPLEKIPENYANTRGLSQADISKFNDAVDERATLKTNLDKAEDKYGVANNNATLFVKNEVVYRSQLEDQIAKSKGLDAIALAADHTIRGGGTAIGAGMTLAIGEMKGLQQKLHFYEQNANKLSDKFTKEANEAEQGFSSLTDFIMRIQDLLRQTFSMA
jgi:hypothetical protein